MSAVFPRIQINLIIPNIRPKFPLILLFVTPGQGVTNSWVQPRGAGPTRAGATTLR